MSDHYPLPSYAVSLWVAGDNLMVAFPGHTIKLPVTVGGLSTVIKILRERETARDRRISNPGTPTQWDAERMLNDAKYKAWLQAMGKAKADKRREKEEAEEFLRELGL